MSYASNRFHRMPERQRSKRLFPTRPIIVGLIAFNFSGAFAMGDERTSDVAAGKAAVSSIESRFSQTPVQNGFESSPKVTRYARYLMAKYDLNRNGRLESNEWNALHGQPSLIDRNEDDEISLSELTDWISDYGRRKRIGIPVVASNRPSDDMEAAVNTTASADPAGKAVAAEGTTAATSERRRDSRFFVPAKRLPQGLPDWFLSRDLDGDGQLTASEFSPSSIAAELAEFSSYDANNDGVLTAQECVRDPSGKSSRKPKQPRQ